MCRLGNPKPDPIRNCKFENFSPISRNFLAITVFESFLIVAEQGYLPESSKKWVEGVLNKVILHFLPYLMIFSKFRGSTLTKFMKNDKKGRKA